MKNISMPRVLVIIAISLLFYVNKSLAQTTSFSSPGNYSYTVPAGITSLYVEVAGARGGNCYSSGGSGGIVVCTLAVTPYEVLNVNVGGAGTDVNYYSTGYGGYNGGGSNYYRAGAGGGGGTDIMRSPYTLYDRVVVAGGGGGAGYNCGYGEWGGNGGDLTGYYGAICYSWGYGGYCGYGGTQYYGGSGGYYGGSSGYFGQGGDAGGYGGGGGGGWYGGGGGYYGGGGGGSSYTDPSSATDVYHYQGYNGGDGYVNITEICSAGPVNGAADLCVGSTETLTPDVPGGTWTSNDAGIASVDYNTGDVTGVSDGSTTITYTQNLSCGDVYTTFDINIRQVPTTITGGPKICKNQTVNFASSPGGNWTSSDNSVASPDFYSGDVFGNSVGTAILTYQIGTSCYTTKTVSVINTAPITGTNNVCQGLVRTLTTAIGGGTWSSGNSSIASVNSTGDVTGGTAGTTQIVYTQTNGCVITRSFTTRPLPAVITGPVAVCNTATITISESTTGGTWSSGTSSEATVVSASSTTGTVKGISAGTSVITYSGSNTCIRTSTITVNPLPAPIVAPARICVTNTANPATTLSDASGTGAWSSSSTVASIGSSSGIISGVAGGFTTITYTLPVTGCYLTTPITVSPAPAPITGNKLICAANDISYLADADLGGTWTSSNTTMAKVDISVGALTGVTGYTTQQNPIITYTLLTGCRAVATVSVNPAPSITGSGPVCVGSSVTLSSAAAGTWSTLVAGYASVVTGPATTTTVTGNTAGNTTVRFALSSTGCTALLPVTVNATPAPITPGTAAICSGASITLNDTDPAGTWSTSSTLVTVGSGGLVTTTGPVTSASTALINYSFATGCKATKIVSINPLPTVYNLASFTGASDYCAGGAGIDLYMNLTTSGIQYKLYNNSIPLPGYLTGAGSALHFGNQTAAGTYTVVAYDPVTTCSSNMTGSPVININPLPVRNTVKYVGPSSAYCDVPGAGVDVILDNSESTVNYTLVKNGVAGTTMTGTGLALDFGLLTDGIYTVTGENATTHCTSNMLSSVTVVKNPLPLVHDVSASDSGYYCAGTSGAHVQLDYGNSGINYQLFNGGPSPIATVSGANAALDLGIRAAGSYTVVAKNATTGCTQNMNGTAVISVRGLPPVHNITGGGKFCFGTAGSVVGVDKTDIGINYQLYNGSTAVGSPVAGLLSGAAISFPPTSAGGTYTVVGTDILTNCSSNMTGSTVVTPNPPLAVFNVTTEGTGSYCVGGPGLHVYLSGSSPFVKYDLINKGVIVATKPVGTGSPIDFGLVTADGAYTVVATDSTSVGCKETMAGNPTITINSLPNPVSVTVDNGGDYCAGGTGVNIGLAFSDAGVTYELYKNSVTTGTKRPGATSSLDFGKFTAAGTYTIVGTNDVTKCSNNMTGAAVVKINPRPKAYTMTGGGSYCIGGTGVPVGLFKSDIGIDYQLFFAGAPFSGFVPGTGSALPFGKQTTAGIYSVMAKDTETGCTSNMADTKVVTIDPLPVQYNVTGGGSYCAGGTGMAVGVDNSVTGVSYQLLNGPSPVKTIVGTTGSPIDFGKQTVGGTYTVLATTVINGCKNAMAGSAVINVNSLPAVDTVKGGGAYCAGDAGADIYMAGSQPGIYYQLYMGGSPIGGAPVLGTGMKADLGLQPVAGTYNVVAANAATGCTNNMEGTATVTINAKPNAYTISGGGTLCAGDAGYHILLSGSQTDVSYDLLRSGSSTPVAVIGSGMALDFGEQTSGGTYTVLGTNRVTGCANTMTGSGIVNVNPVPLPFAVTGGGNYCSGREGVAIDLANSENGVNYQLLNGGIATGAPVGGTGLPITFGMQTMKGSSYTVRATNVTTSCSSDMTGSTAVVIDPLVTPAVSIDGTDGTACIGELIHYAANPVDGGTAPTYVWKVNGTIVGVGSTYTNIPATGDLVSVEMTSNANCAITTKADNSVTISAVPYATPVAVIVAEPGNNVCKGTPVSITATPSFEGSAPVYSWLKNGVFVGTGTTYSYTPNSSNDKDVITFMLQSSYHCKTSDTVFSDPIVMTVDSAVVPVFTITSSFGPKDDAVAVGQIDTFTAVIDRSPFYSRYNYTYQWYIQGTPVPGADQPVYIDHAVYNNDVVSCVVTKQGACGTQTATEKTVVVVKNLAAQQLVTISDVSVVPNPNKGEFTVKGTLGSNNNGEATLEITNMLGQSVYTNNVKTPGGNIMEHIKLRNTLANGMYLLNIRSGAATSVFHIVIEQ